MSNRAEFVGSAPTTGSYIPLPVPGKGEDLPTYINDELLRLGGTVNNVLEGGSLPPRSELPKRYREGMVMNFSKGVGDGVNSAGIWQYKSGKWLKLLDDPTEISEPLQQQIDVISTEVSKNSSQSVLRANIGIPVDITVSPSDGERDLLRFSIPPSDVISNRELLTDVFYLVGDSSLGITLKTYIKSGSTWNFNGLYLLNLGSGSTYMNSTSVLLNNQASEVKLTIEITTVDGNKTVTVPKQNISCSLFNKNNGLQITTL